MFSAIFRDGSEAEIRGSLGIYVASDFLKDDYEAFLFANLLNSIEPNSSYTSKKYSAILEADRKDPLFLRIFIEDNFTNVSLAGDVPEVPYKNTRSPFIVE